MTLADHRTRPTVVTEEQREFYDRNGYLMLERIVPDDWLRRLRAATDEMVERSRPLGRSDAVFDLEPDHTAENPRLRRVTSPVDQHPDYWEFASTSVIADVAADLIGPDVKFHHSKLNFKWARGGAEVKWHQDIQFWPHTNYSPLTIGTYLYGRTRLPKVYGSELGFPWSFFFLIAASVTEMMQVALNEWGHSLWIAEEIFAAPFHWPFVLYGWLALALFALWAETLLRLMAIERELDDETAETVR